MVSTLLILGILALPGMAHAASSNSAISSSKPETSVTAWDKDHPENLQESNLYAQSALLIDARTGDVLFSKSPNTPLNPASITKILTALVVLEKANLDDSVTIGLSAMGALEATWIPLATGDQVTVRDLLYGMMLKSYNDAAAALAVHVGGSLSGFAEMMNRKAQELGCTNSNFVVPHGLTANNHQTTVNDMAKIMRAAMQNETFRQIVVTSSYTLNVKPARDTAVIAVNTNKMLPDSGTPYAYEGCIGGKSGYTLAAQHTYVVAAQRDGVSLIAVMMGTNGPEGIKGDTKWLDAAKLLDYGFAMYKRVDIAALYAGSPFQCDVSGCVEGDSGVLRLDLGEVGALGGIIARKDSDAFDAETFRRNVTIEYVSENITAPVEKGQKVAEMTYRYGMDQSVTIDLLASRDILQSVAPSVDASANVQYAGSAVMPPTLTDIASGIEHSPTRYLALLLLVPVFILVGLIISMMMDVSRRKKRLRGRISRTRGY